MTSEFAVFMYLDGAPDAVPAGLLTLVEDGDKLLQSTFRYGRRYAERRQAMALDPLTLSLPGLGVDAAREPPLTTAGRLAEFGVIRDAAPDGWGRRVIENRLRRAGPLSESVYLRQAGFNRTGALDFRDTPKSPETRGAIAQPIDLGHLQEAAERIEAGETIPVRHEKIFDAGTSMGGARPKVVVESDGRQWLAKFSLPSDAWAIPDVERATLLMASKAGLKVPEVRPVDIGERRRALLIERFDRHRVGEHYARRHFLSALTLLGRHESESHHASYAEISQAIATHCAAPCVKADQAELFGRMVFNILVHNNDDHLRNHGFLFDAAVGGWRLAPLYDVVPAPSLAEERFLHLRVGEQGRLATLTNAMTRHGVFGLTRPQAVAHIERICSVVREWKQHFENAGVSGNDIERVAAAFRKPRSLGLAEITKT